MASRCTVVILGGRKPIVVLVMSTRALAFGVVVLTAIWPNPVILTFSDGELSVLPLAPGVAVKKEIQLLPLPVLVPDRSDNSPPS